LESRARYLLECIRSIRANVPEDYPVIMRISAHDDYLENGLTIEDLISFSLMAKEAGVDALNVSRGNSWGAAVKYEVPPIDLPRGFNVENAARIKKETGMLVMAVGRINDPQQAESIIAEGKADMVVMGRAQIADPDFCAKAASGRDEDIIRCIACDQGCVDRYTDPAYSHLSCLRNPAVGREKEFEPAMTDNPKRILIAGGGMGGLEAAIVLKNRGHEPILAEASDHLGGQFILAGIAPRKGEMGAAAVSRAFQAQKAGVDIRLNTTVSPALIDEVSPDVVIIASGATPAMLDIPGAQLPIVCNYADVLTGQSKLSGKVVVVGGGLVGIETAEYLAAQGCEVTVIEMLEGIARELGNFRMICVMENLYMAGIKTMDRTKAVEIKEDAVVVERDGEMSELPANAVVIAIGGACAPYDELSSYCESKSLPYYVIGDAKSPRRAINAIEEAAELARAI